MITPATGPSPGLYRGWLLVVAIGLALVAVGSLIDFLLRRQEVIAFHRRLLRFEQLIKSAPLSYWQQRIAAVGVSFLDTLRSGAMWVLTWLIVLSGLLIGKLAWRHFSRENNEDPSSYDGARAVSDTLASAGVALLFADYIAAGLLLFFYLIFDHWLFGVLLLPCGLLALNGVCRSALAVQELRRQVIETWGEDDAPEELPAETTLDKIYTFVSHSVLPTGFISVALSLAAILVSVSVVAQPLQNNYWFYQANGAIIPRHPALLSTVNYPFDALTVAVAILLLRYVAARGRWILLATLLNVICSALLSVLLYAALLLIQEGGTVMDIATHIRSAAGRLYALTLYVVNSRQHAQPESVMPDLHLLPLLATTFVPVALYSVPFLIISFSKPVLQVSARIFGAVGEKEESAFRQLGTLIAALMAAAKAIYDYLVAL